MLKNKYQLNVEYPANKYNEGYDDKIEKLIGFMCESSGMGFGVRDMQFDFDNENNAKKAKMKVKKALPDCFIKVTLL
jgi:hypothetical protein